MYSLDINIFWLGLMSGAYFVTYTIMQIPSGIFYDNYKVKEVIIFPLIICTLGGFLFSITPNVYIGALARLIMGFGAAFAFVGALVVASEVFEEKYFSLMAGITQTFVAIGAIMGEAPLVPLLENFGWRMTIVIMSTGGVLIVFAILFFMKLPQKNKSKVRLFDIKKGLKKISKSSQSWIIAAYACLLWAPMTAVASLYGPDFFKAYFNYSIEIAAMLTTAMWVGVAVGAPLFGFLATKIFNNKFWLITAALIGALSFSIILYIPITSLIILTIAVFFAGVGCGGQALSFVLVKDNNEDENSATAMGFNNTAVVVSGFIFQPLVGYVIKYNSGMYGNVNEVLQYSASSYLAGMNVILGCYIIAAFISIFLIKDKS